MSHVPDYLQSTVDMIKASYSTGIPETDYFPLLFILKEKGKMSDRSIAKAIAGIRGGGYVRYHYDVSHELPNTVIEDSLINSVISKLRPHGYDVWIEED